ncbi:MAG: hypothetical protein HUJ24_00135 [Rhodobacteraceae bacterium]|nr:hypothetical protein [Paracoccaceae bacterium]
MEVRYPHIDVQLTGEDGNAFAILARCTVAGRRAGLDQKELLRFGDEATAADYGHLLRTALSWFNCL